MLTNIPWPGLVTGEAGALGCSLRLSSFRCGSTGLPVVVDSEVENSDKHAGDFSMSAITRNASVPKLDGNADQSVSDVRDIGPTIRAMARLPLHRSRL